MEPLNSEALVIEAAKSMTRRLGDIPNHTVAAAAMDTSGQIHTAVNVSHFTGGPCAELVVLGVAAAAQAGPLVTMAAAGDDDRGLLPPCGRCRQVMLDLHPDLLVAVPGTGGATMRPIRTLLPDAYFSPDASAQRVLRLNKRYFDDVVGGRKVSTVRWDEPAAVGPVTFYFEDSEEHPPLRGHITTVESYRLSDLTPERLHLADDASVQDVSTGLRRLYPLMPHDAEVDILTFRTDDSES